MHAMKWRIPQPIRNVLAQGWVHHNLENMKLARLAMAKDQQLGEQHVHDFPANSTTSTNIRTGSPLATAVTAASVLGAVGAGAVGVKMLTPDPAAEPTAPTTVVQPAPPVTSETANAKAQIELFYNDPEKGLVPISGAASKPGADLTPKTP